MDYSTATQAAIERTTVGDGKGLGWYLDVVARTTRIGRMRVGDADTSQKKAELRARLRLRTVFGLEASNITHFAEGVVYCDVTPKQAR